MTQLAADTFDRSNTGTLGANWSVGTGASGQFEILSNAANCPSGTGTAVDYYSAVSWPADQYSEVTLGTVGTTSDEGSGPAVRWSSSAHTGYFVQTNTTETYLYRVNAGSYSSPLATGAACAANDVLKLTVTGTGGTVSLVCTKNGNAFLSYDDTSASRITSGNAALWGSASSGACSIASWTGGDTGGAAGVILSNWRPMAGGMRDMG